MRVVVGLGNPGARYEKTRHNVGFAVVDELARRLGVGLAPGAANRIGCSHRRGEPVMLVEPQMFMNCSGEALLCLDPIPAAPDLIVVHDELDLGCGAVRVKQGGGNAGHRGLQSLTQAFGSEFTRVRVGIGRPLLRSEVVDYVLSPVDESQSAAISRAIDVAADAVEYILDEGATTAMNRFNSRQSNDEEIAQTSQGGTDA